MNSNQLTRKGLNPRLICYSMSFSPRKLEFLDPPTQQKYPELKGNLKGKVTLMRKDKTKEYRKFLLPDTFRTTNPSPMDDTINQTIIQSSVHSPSNIHSLTYKSMLYPTHYKSNRTSNRRNFMSSCMENLNDSFSLNVINNTSKRELKETSLIYYNNTTQIVALPGGVKREASLINDNQSFRNYQLKSSQSNKSLSYKISREYRSNVSCLPARNYNAQIKDMDMPNERSLSKFKDKYIMENSDYNIISPKNPNLNKSTNDTCRRITNIQVVDNNTNTTRNTSLKGEANNKNYHLFNTSSKRLLNAKNMTSQTDYNRGTLKKSISRKELMTSTEESKIVASSKAKKPLFIKNAFTSQIQFN